MGHLANEIKKVLKLMGLAGFQILIFLIFASRSRARMEEFIWILSRWYFTFFREDISEDLWITSSMHGNFQKLPCPVILLILFYFKVLHNLITTYSILVIIEYQTFDVFPWISAYWSLIYLTSVTGASFTLFLGGQHFFKFFNVTGL